MIEEVKALSSNQHFILRGLSSLAPMRYTCIKSLLLLNTLSSEISWPVSTNMSILLEMGLKVCSNGHAPLTVMPIYGKIMIIKKISFYFSNDENCSNDDAFISCNEGIEKMLHNICISALAISLR